MRYNKTFTPAQIPDFLLEDLPRASPADEFPIFVEFLDKYYDFIGDYTIDLEQVKDSARIPEELLQFLRAEFAPKFPRARINDRRLIEIVRNLFREKGTIGSFELIFRLFLDEVITITEPNKQILRASDGKWLQERSIVCDTSFLGVGFDRENITKIKISNGFNFFFVSVKRVEIVSSTVTRFYYTNNIDIVVNEYQKIDCIKTGLIVYRGIPKKQPARLKIVKPGEKWRLGQIFKIPSTVVPSIAQITKVGPNGEVRGVKLIQIGYEHVESEQLLISPYPNKPAESDYNIDEAIVGLNPDNSYIYHFTLTVNDRILNIDEEITASSDITYSQKLYFLEDYVEKGYVGYIEFNQSRKYLESEFADLLNQDISLDDWLRSRATFLYEFDYVTIYPGKAASADGMLSDPAIKLFDSYFYQLFSYVIHSRNDLKQYAPILDILHPAGFKHFQEYHKEAHLAISALVDRTPPSITIYPSDFVWILEEAIKHVVKEVADSVGAIDYSFWNFIKNLEETSTAIDGIALTPIKGFDDSTTNDEYLEFDINNTQSDSSSAQDITVLTFTAKYNDEMYFGEGYTQNETFTLIDPFNLSQNEFSTINMSWINTPETIP